MWFRSPKESGIKGAKHVAKIILPVWVPISAIPALSVLGEHIILKTLTIKQI